MKKSVLIILLFVNGILSQRVTPAFLKAFSKIIFYLMKLVIC